MCVTAGAFTLFILNVDLGVQGGICVFFSVWLFVVVFFGFSCVKFAFSFQCVTTGVSAILLQHGENWAKG